MAGADVTEQLLDFVVARVVAADGDPMTAPRRKLLCGFVDGARNVVCRGAAPDAASGDVDRRSTGAELQSDTAPGPSAGPSHQSDDVLQERTHLDALDPLPVLHPLCDQLHALPIVASIQDGQILWIGAQVDTGRPRAHLGVRLDASDEIP